MAIESDVLVVGGGLAGLIAAITAARKGAYVRVVSYKQSTLRQASGLVDVLGYVDGRDDPVIDPFDAIETLRDRHPYRIVGVDGVREGLALFDDVVNNYHGDHTDANALVPTHGGAVKPTARYPAGTAAGLASDPSDALFVGFHRIADFDAPHVAAHLAASDPPFEADGVTVAFPGQPKDDARVTNFAKRLDEDSAVTLDGRTQGVRRALSESVEPHVDGHDRIGFPAILGMDHAEIVRSSLEAEIGVDVFEVPMGPPSLPGIRLESQLLDALDAAGADVETGNPVVGYTGRDRIDHVIVDRNGARVPYAAEQFVLATGGLVGKGIETGRETVHEPLFDCYVSHASDRSEWFADDVFGDHAFPRFGVSVGTDLQPLDKRGEPSFENLRAAGSIIGGYDLAAEKSGSGVSIATGYAAGTGAAEVIS